MEWKVYPQGKAIPIQRQARGAEEELAHSEWCSSPFHVDAFPRVHMSYDEHRHTHTPEPDRTSSPGGAQEESSIAPGYFFDSRPRKSRHFLYLSMLYDKAEGAS